jgi:hypothetical protein
MREGHAHAIRVDKVKERFVVGVRIIEVSVVLFLPEWIVAVEITKPNHVVVIAGVGNIWVTGEEGRNGVDRVVVIAVVVDVEQGNSARGGTEAQSSDVT